MPGEKMAMPGGQNTQMPVTSMANMGMQPGQIPHQPPPQQFHPMMQPGPAMMGGPPMPPHMMGMAAAPVQKELTMAFLCRIGQEAVQEIVQKTMEIFQSLKSITLPNSTAMNMQQYQDRRMKLEEHIKRMTMLFHRLRTFYTKVNETCATLVQNNEENLIPYEEDEEGNLARQTEVYQYGVEERKEVIEQVRMKNRQLKEIVDQLRTIIWEINTMMAMRHT